jgi:hypothetical protein
MQPKQERGHPRVSRRGTFALVIILLLAAAIFTFLSSQPPSNPSTTITQAGTFTLTPTSGAAGTTVTFTGTGYAAAGANCVDAVAADPPTLFSGGAAASCSINPEHELRGKFIVSSDAAAGVYKVTIAGQFVPQGAITAPFAVVVAPVPNINLSQPTGSGGDNITFTGTGFNLEDTVCTMNFYRMKETIKNYQCHITGGIVHGWFLVKTSGNPAGSREIAITGNLLDTATAVFTVVPRILITPNPVDAGNTLTISGSNYVIAGDCSKAGNWLLLPPGITVTYCTIDENYIVKATLAVSNTAPPATYTIILTDGIVEASATVTVQPSGTPAPPLWAAQSTLVSTRS